MAKLSKRMGGPSQYDLIVVEPDLSPDNSAASGYALCAWWREQTGALARAGSEGDVAAVTEVAEVVAVAQAPDLEACAAFGIRHCFAKPFDERCLAMTLSKWLIHRD